MPSFQPFLLQILPKTALILLSATAINAVADSVIDETLDDRRLQTNQAVAMPIFTPTEPSLPTAQDGRTAVADETTLLANPALLSRALLSALVYNNSDGVAVLLPIYQKQSIDAIEPQMIQWANAVLSGKNRQFSHAISDYQALHQAYPNNPIFTVRLAQNLFANKQYTQADELIKTLPTDFAKELSPYTAAIERMQKPNFQLGGNIIIDKNINNAPNNPDLGGGWTASTPESARGIAINASLDRNFLLDQGMTLTPALSVQGKLYQDAKHYNEISARFGMAMGKHSHANSLTITPFYEQTHYAGGKKTDPKLQHFNDSVGFDLTATHRFDAKNQLSLSASISKNFHHLREHLTGHSVSISPTFSTRPAVFGQDAWLAIGADYQYNHTQDKDDSYRRTGIRASFGKKWHDFGMRGSVAIAKRRYLAPMPIFNQTQINHEHHASLSLWHDKLSYRNFTPRLTWQHQKTDSTIGLYSYDKNRLFVELSGSF